MAASNPQLARADSKDEFGQQTSVDRALTLLFAFAGCDHVGVTELARRTSLPKSTAHRLLAVLVERGLVDRHGTYYSLGSSIFELATRSPHARLREAAMPAAAELGHLTGQTVHLGVIEGGEVLCLERLDGQEANRIPTRVGCRLPAHCTSLGKAILAHSPPDASGSLLREGLRPYTGRTIVRSEHLVAQLREAAQTGVAYDDEELQPGLACIAAPIRDRSGYALAAVSVAGLPQAVEHQAKLVRRAALCIEQSLRGSRSAHESSASRAPGPPMQIVRSR